MEEVRLWRKNSMGVGTWRVKQVIESATKGHVLIAHSVTLDGSEVQHVDPIVLNGSGRNLQQQMDLEMSARISRQLDKGYKRTFEEALAGSTNQLGLVNPMLAQKLKDVKLTGSHFAGAYVQRKFDGHRCLITKQGGDMMAYTRKGKPITTVPHVLEDAERWMQDGDTLDGELYIHGIKLQAISSLIKRQQSASAQLCYNWYDMVLPKVFSERHGLMKDLYANVRTDKISFVKTIKVERMSDVYSLFKQHRAEGYEGSMLRLSIAGYQDGLRAQQLIKVKEREDGEVLVLGARPSSQGWAILRVRFHHPTMSSESDPELFIREFDISAPGSVPEKLEVMQNIDKYVGRKLTIEYAMLTDDYIPFHAVATRWFDDLS